MSTSTNASTSISTDTSTTTRASTRIGAESAPSWTGAPPEPGLTPADLVARAEALQPRLRDEQAETERRGRYSRETHAALVQAGCYRLLQPRRYGGYEFDIPTFYRVVIAVARGCPSTGWCLSLGAAHALGVASYYTEQAQAEIFGAQQGHFQAPHRPDAQGTARPVDGGYIVSGKWGYLSGIPYASHILVGCRLVAPDGGRLEGPPVVLQAVVPAEQFEMLEDWGDMLGMKGSGSNSAVVRDAFLPERWAVNWNAVDRERGTPGMALHGNPLYLGHVWPLGVGEIAAALVGTARAALDEYEQILRAKAVDMPSDPGTTIRMYQTVESQRNFGNAMVMVDTAEELLIRAGEKFMELGERWRHEGTPFTPEDDVRLSMLAYQSCRLAVDAVELMFSTCRTTPARDGQRMQRYWRDVCMFKANRGAQVLDSAPMLARLHFGLPPGSPFTVSPPNPPATTL